MGVDVLIGLPMLLGVWKEKEVAEEGDVMDGVLIVPASDGDVCDVDLLASARILNLLFISVARGGLNG